MATRFKITQSKEDIIATGGIAMVGALLNDNRGLARVDKMTTDRIKKGWISNSGIIKSVVGLFTLARTDFADIELFRDELAFRLALELERVPSEETLRQRLDLIAKLNSRQTLLDYAMRDLLRKVESFGTEPIIKLMDTRQSSPISGARAICSPMNCGLAVSTARMERWNFSGAAWNR